MQKKNQTAWTVSFTEFVSQFALWLVVSEIVEFLNLKTVLAIAVSAIAGLIDMFNNKNKRLGFAYCFWDGILTFLQYSLTSILSCYAWLYDGSLPAKIYVFSVIALMKQLLLDSFKKKNFAIKDKFFYACVILAIALTCATAGEVEKAASDSINVISVQYPEIHELSTCSFIYINPLETAIVTVIKLFPYATITFVLGLFIKNKDLQYLGTPDCNKDYNDKLKDTFFGTIYKFKRNYVQNN